MRTLQLAAWWLPQCALTMKAQGTAAVHAVVNAPSEVRAKLKAMSLQDADPTPSNALSTLQQLEAIHVENEPDPLSAAVPRHMTKLDRFQVTMRSDCARCLH